MFRLGGVLSARTIIQSPNKIPHAHRAPRRTDIPLRCGGGPLQLLLNDVCTCCHAACPPAHTSNQLYAQHCTCLFACFLCLCCKFFYTFFLPGNKTEVVSRQCHRCQTPARNYPLIWQGLGQAQNANTKVCCPRFSPLMSPPLIDGGPSDQIRYCFSLRPFAIARVVSGCPPLATHLSFPPRLRDFAGASLLPETKFRA